MPTFLSWSGGADSSCSVILCHENGIHVDEIVMAELLFDRDKETGEEFSCEHVIHMDWVKNYAKKLFEKWGYKVTILKAEKTYMDHFHHIIQKGDSAHIGMQYGFPIIRGGMCALKRDGKIRTIEKYLNQYDPVYQIVGISADEVTRLDSLYSNRSGNKSISRSVLAEFGITHSQAIKICKQYGLYSPAYDALGLQRLGCWCCGNAKPNELRYIKENFPHEFKKFVTLADEEVAFPKWNPYGMPLCEVEKFIEGGRGKA